MKNVIKTICRRKRKEQKPVKKAKFGVFSAFFRSFYDKNLYLDVKENWQGMGFRYALLLSMILAVPWSVKEAYDLHHYFNQTVVPCMKQLPDLMIKDGRFNFNKPSPYLIKNSKGVPSIILDNKSDFDFLQKRYHDAFLIIHQNKFAIKLPNMSYQESVLDSKITDQVSVGRTLKQLLETKKSLLFYWTLYLTMGFSLFAVILVFLFIFTLIVPFISKSILKYKLDTRSSCRVAAVSSTPAFVVMFAFYLSGYTGAMLGMLTFTLIYGYYFFAVHTIKNARHELVVQEDMSV